MSRPRAIVRASETIREKVGTILRVKAPQLSVRNFSDVVGVRPMEDDAPKALIVRPTSGLQQHDSGAEKSIIRSFEKEGSTI